MTTGYFQKWPEGLKMTFNPNLLKCYGHLLLSKMTGRSQVDLLLPASVQVTCAIHPRIIMSKSHGNTQKYINIMLDTYSDYFSKLTPQSVACLPKDHIVCKTRSHGNTSIYVVLRLPIRSVAGGGQRTSQNLQISSLSVTKWAKNGVFVGGWS